MEVTIALKKSAPQENSTAGGVVFLECVFFLLSLSIAIVHRGADRSRTSSPLSAVSKYNTSFRVCAPLPPYSCAGTFNPSIFFGDHVLLLVSEYLSGLNMNL